MKNLSLCIGIMSILFSCNPSETEVQESTSIDESASIEETNHPSIKSATLEFDSLRALKLEADQYGMRKYVMAFLKRGPNRGAIDSAQAVELQKGHMTNIRRLAQDGKLALAGPFYGDGDLRGIYIFAVDNLEEAKKLTESDPAIQAGSLEMELIPWYGSAALMEVNETHKLISKIKI